MPTKIISLRIDEKLLSSITERANNENRSVSNMIICMLLSSLSSCEKCSLDHGIIDWFENDYLPRVGAYRKDCKYGCDACTTLHNGDNYCDIENLSKVCKILKEQLQSM